MSNDYDVQASICRKEAKNISVRHYNDAEIDSKIDLWQAKFHKDVGRTSPWLLANDPIDYKVAKLAIIHVVAADLMSSIEELTDDGEKKMKEYLDIVDELTENTFIMASAGTNNADELEPANYTAVQSETTPDLGVENGL